MSGFNGDSGSGITSISEEVKAAGMSVGVDVEKLRAKYLSAKLVSNLETQSAEDSLKIKQQLEDAKRMRELESKATGSKSIDSTKVSSSSNALGLDNVVICARCGGQVRSN